MERKILTGLLPDEITRMLPPGKETYRGIQIFRWIHERGAESFAEMTNLPKAFREEITGQFEIGTLRPVTVQTSSDGSTHKFLWETGDGNRIESVIIRGDDRVTACISSQVGCRMGCRFCRTGTMKLTRNLTSGEIVDQLIRMRRMLRESGEDITNIVFMGMGEPMDNFEEVLRAITIINMETAISIGQRKVTVSTSGIVPGILRLAGEYRKIGLAVSLNATTDALRTSIMPVNRKFPLRELLDACRDWVRKTKRRVTFEYILMEGVNDSPDDARRLISIVRSVPSKVNLIAYNAFEGSPFRRPDDARIETFQRILTDANITAIIRQSKGNDILAACGQLAAKPENKKAASGGYDSVGHGRDKRSSTDEHG